MTSTASCTPNNPVLVLNAVENRVQLAVGRAERLLFAQEMTVTAKALSVLPQAVQACVQDLSQGLEGLGGIAVVRGPGAFTGVRVSMAFVLGLARGRNLPMAGLDYLSVLGIEPCTIVTGEVWICTYARKGLVHIQGFSAPQGQPLCPVQSLSREEALACLQARSGPVFLAGSGLRQDPKWWKEQLGRAHILPRSWDHPRPETLLQAATGVEYRLKPPMPVYLRPSDAEMHLADIARARGLNPQSARRLIPDFEHSGAPARTESDRHPHTDN